MVFHRSRAQHALQPRPCDTGSYSCACVSFHSFALEGRRVHASMERPKKHHQIVPTIPHSPQAVQPFLSLLNITPKAKAEIGKSPKNKTPNGSLAGPSRIGLFETSIRAEASANMEACTTGAVIRARGRLRKVKPVFGVRGGSGIPFGGLSKGVGKGFCITESCAEGRPFSTECALKVLVSLNV